MRLFQPEITRSLAGGKIVPSRRERTGPPKPGRTRVKLPGRGAPFDSWFKFLRRLSATHFATANQARVRSRRAPVSRGRWQKQWTADLQAFKGLLGARTTSEEVIWGNDSTSAEFGFLLQPDLRGKRRFQVILRLPLTIDGLLLQGFSLEMIDETTNPSRHFERRRGIPMLISSSSSSYLATPPPSGR